MINKQYSKERIKKGVAYALCALLAVFLLVGLFTFGASAADTCVHEWDENGYCWRCETYCQHGSMYTYKDNNLPDNKHTRIEYCPDCQTDLYTDTVACTWGDDGLCTYCGSAVYPDEVVNCPHSFDNSICNGCGFTCKHSSIVQGYCSLCGYCEHWFWTNGACDECGKICSHSYYVNYECSVCFEPCHHSQFVEGICDRCGYPCEHTWENGECSVCGVTCTHTWSLGGVCTECNTLCTHVWTLGVCGICTTECAHASYEDGFCTLCGMACAHSYETTKCESFSSNYYHYSTRVCTICSYSVVEMLPHKFIQFNVLDKPYHSYNYSCGSCGKVLVTNYSSPNYPDATPNYFHPAPFASYWNSVVSEPLFQYVEASRQHTHFFSRVSIDVWGTHNKASSKMTNGIEKLTLENGYDYDVKASRYLVIRMRKYNIGLFEIDIMGGLGVDSVSSYGFADYYYRGLHTLPDNQWFNLVVDLSTFTVSNGDEECYVIGDTIDSFYLNLCAYYISGGGYIDYEYYALCNDMDEVHAACNAFNDAFVSCDLGLNTYLASSSSTTLIDNGHSFDFNSICDICWYKCNHSEQTITQIQDSKHCGEFSTCDMCGYEVSRTVSLHSFADGNESSVCLSCGYSCKHLYSIGKCIYCDRQCEHEYLPNHASCKWCYYIGDTPTENDDTLAFDLITAIYDAQSTTFLSLLNYNIFGVNFAMVVGALIVLAVTIFIIKKVK